MGWSHDSEKKNNAYNDQQMLDRFVHVVNSQNEYNTNGVNAVPILIWHKIDNTNEEYSTSMGLFEAEMKYLYDNGFTVLTMADLVYDEGSNYLKINEGNDNVPIPATERDFAAKINDVDEDNSPDNAQSFTNNAESSGLAQIFKGSSPFDDGGKLEVLEGHPEGANIPFMPDAPQEFASGLDTDLRKLAQQLKVK